MQYTKGDKMFVQAFIDAHSKIEALLFRALHEGNTAKARYHKQQAEQILRDMRELYGDWSDNVHLGKYIDGYNKIEQNVFGSLILGDQEELIGQIGPVHVDSVAALAQSSRVSVYSTLDGIQKQINYTMALAQQQNIQQTLASGLVSGFSLEDQKSSILSYLGKGKKLSILRDRIGKKWNPKTYAEMLVRTETARAYNQGKVNRALELGYTVFKVVEKYNCCDICSQHNGKIYDMRKGSADLPPYHPNCQGTIEIVQEDIPPQLIAKETLAKIIKTQGYKDKISETIVSGVSGQERAILAHLGYDNPHEYRHTLSNYSITHIMKRHGVSAKLRPTEIAVTTKDISIIPHIISEPDSVTISPQKSRRGEDVLLYEKVIDQKIYYYVASLHKETKEITTKTFYINLL